MSKQLKTLLSGEVQQNTRENSILDIVKSFMKDSE